MEHSSPNCVEFLTTRRVVIPSLYARFPSVRFMALSEKAPTRRQKAVTFLRKQDASFPKLLYARSPSVRSGTSGGSAYKEAGMLPFLSSCTRAFQACEWYFRRKRLQGSKMLPFLANSFGTGAFG